MKRKGFLLLTILIPLAWIVSQLLPVLLMHNLLINYRVHFETYGLLEFARMIGALVWWYIIELSIALVIIQLASQLLSAISTPRFREGLLKVTAILFSLFISAYFLLLNLSWYWHSSYGNFLQITTLTKVLSLVDLKSSASVLAPADMFLALILSLAFITIWGLSFLLIRALQTKKKICHECLRICSFLILLLLPAVASVLLLRESDRSSLHSQRLSHEYRFHLSPQFALISDLLEDDGEVAGHAFLSSISLDTSESYEDYLQRVTEKPLRNVFVFLVEALRSDIIFKRFEDKEITPHLNQLAKKSSFFPLGFSHSAETSFGQISLLTGQHPIMQSKLMAANLDLQRNKFLLHELFHELGYHSVYLSHHWSKTAEILKPSPNRINLYFDRRVHGLGRLESDLLASNPSVIEEFHNNQRSSDALILATIQKTIEERRASKPIFAAAYLESTHFPYYQLGEDQRLFDVALSPNKLNFTSYPESYTSDAYKLYLNTLHSLDYELGQFIKFLNDQNILKDSIIVVTGDHGQAFHEKGFVGHSTPLVWEVINVPLIFFDGSKRHSMRLWSESVSHIDIAPSLLELLNLPATTLFQGRSLFRPSLCESPVVSANLLLNDFAVIYNELKYRVNSRTGKECLSLGEAVALCGPFEGELLNAANSFSDYLSLFLSTQFAYYDAPKAFREKHAPPAIPCLSTASREAILNSRLHLSETVTSSSFRYEPGKAREG